MFIETQARVLSRLDLRGGDPCFGSLASFLIGYRAIAVYRKLVDHNPVRGNRGGNMLQSDGGICATCLTMRERARPVDGLWVFFFFFFFLYGGVA